jgi:hypothetical protein
MNQGKIKKVTIEFENVTYIAEGKDVESWLDRVNALENLGHSYGMGEWKQWTQIIKKGVMKNE